MHYKDGTPAELMDVVFVNGTIGVVKKLTPGSETCNGQIFPLLTLLMNEGKLLAAFPIFSQSDHYFTVGEAMKVRLY